jgi:Domain of unknown function (DUF5710)
MTPSKTYLTVAFAQKDAAKALGAKWDATLKKWYVPADKDIALFAQWHIPSETIDTATPRTNKPKASTIATKTSVSTDATGVITYATDKNFIAYNGAAPPWD